MVVICNCNGCSKVTSGTTDKKNQRRKNEFFVKNGFTWYMLYGFYWLTLHRLIKELHKDSQNFITVGVEKIMVTLGEGDVTLQLSWTIKTNPCAVTSLLK